MGADNPAPLAPTPRLTRADAVSLEVASSSTFSAVVGEPVSSDAACFPKTETCRRSASERVARSRGAFLRDSLVGRSSSTTPEDREVSRARYVAAAMPKTTVAVAASHHEVSPRTASPIRMLNAPGELSQELKMCVWKGHLLVCV